MKRIKLTLILVPLILSLVACGAGNVSNTTATQEPETSTIETNSVPPTDSATELPTDTPTQAPAETAGDCYNPYMPIIVGATWNYKLNGPIPDTYTHSVVSLESNGFTEQDVFGTGVTRQGQWTCENGDLIALSPPSGSSGTVSAENVTVDFETKEWSGITLPGTINAGDTWSQSITLEGSQTINGAVFPASNKTTSDCKAIGVESVTVEAGTFDAMRVECQNVIAISLKMGEQEIATTFNLTGTSWYVENIGMIKNATTGEGLDSTSELVSYNIP
jgi:hypothetical protein